MEFTEGAYLPAELEAPAFGVPDDQSVQEAVERIEPFLKGQGYLPIGGRLRVHNATAEEAYQVLDLIFRLASQQQLDDRSREQLRDQADKDRVALAHAQKKNESLEEGNRKLMAQVKELESKLLAAKHKADEQERELKQKLQSTTARLNGYLYGGRDAGKRTVAGAGCGGGANSSAGVALRKMTPAYDRFLDDPAEAAAASQKLEAELSQLKQQNTRLKKQLAAAREQLGSSPRAVGSGDSPLRDGQRGDQLATVPEAMRSSLSDFRSASLSSASNEVVRLQRLVRELQMTVEQQQRQLDKATGDRSELHKTLSSLRSKCATLEVERKNAEDRFLRAQRATAALLEPEAQSTELRGKLAVAERDLHEANCRADLLQQRLVAAEVELESNQRHMGVLKRAIRALPKGQQALDQLGQLLAEELEPLRAQLRSAKLELEVARSQAVLTVRTDEPSCAGGTEGQDPPSSRGQSARWSAEGLPLSPALPLPASPPARFDGFRTRPGLTADSPQLMMQPPPIHAFYNRAYSSTMPSERLLISASPLEGPLDVQPSRVPGEQPGFGDPSSGGMQQGGTGSCSGAAGSGAVMRRSMSAGVAHRVGDAYTSAERQRARWQVHNTQARQRFPSPIDIIMEQARNPTTADATISIVASPIP
ncbi:hypothetical protein VOLCADRAFT_121263 [Volvox carteri f. nagariensis]|uniref:Uncharacterized protein n=1 Tax=Volvox carteri f. nagariensis TaxID=3068 RepID=D8U665_VOLCA|nr:uncharacterized protein VOLCADRAFT_121263 [Volvox carteri f. nagariensis]EFJ44885.1 hypothetical protein VOLCADRAFT_121263 [Volvox carteri f. nagariensis]|eukprot:XP_002954168.1 hypothetical protein VOLCADRAFT_121263 [Volvox carteri f. nagariensis]